MKKILLITWSSLKKKKANAIVLMFLVALAVMFMYISINSLTSVNSLLDEKVKKANLPDVMIACKAGHEDYLSESLASIPGFDYYETEPTIMIGSANIIHEDNSESMMTTFVNYDYSRTSTVPCFVGKTLDTFSDDCIALPFYLKASKNYKIGDTLKISSSSGDFTFRVYGFTEDVYFASPNNLTCYKVFVKESFFNQLVALSENPNSPLYDGDFYKIYIKDGYDDAEFSNNLDKLTGSDELSVQFSVDLSTMKTGTSYFVNILMAILMLFGFIIIVVSLVVIRFSISSHIENNMKNLGTLSSIGYTSHQLRLSATIEFVLIAAIGGVIGLVLPLFFESFIVYELELSWGLGWNCPYDFGIAIITYFAVILFIIGLSYFSSRKFRTITPLVALRNGIETHNYKRNTIPLTKSKLNRNVSLGLKNMVYNRRQSISIMIIVCLLTYICLIMVTIYRNFTDSDGAMVDIVGQEKPDLSASMMTEGASNEFYSLKEEFTNLPGVENTISHDFLSLTYVNQDNETSVGTHIFSEVTNLVCKTMLSGREPINSNEVAITNVIAKTLHAELGDIIYITYEDNRAEYYVSGIIQHMNNMGKGARMTADAYKRINPAYVPRDCYIYLNSKASSEDFIAKYAQTYASHGVEFFDYNAMFDLAMASISDTMETICLVLIAITCIVVVLITILIIKMKLLKDRKITGIYKAIGYTSPELIIQTIISFVPVVLIGAIIGGILCRFSANAVFAACLANTGIKTVSLDINNFIIALGIGIISCLSLVITYICSLRITKVEPYTMIVEI